MNGIGTVTTEIDSRRVLDLLQREPVDVILLDLFMPHISGMELLPLIRERYPQIPVIVATAAYELERAVECMKQGAFDYLVKPVDNERLLVTLNKALEWIDVNNQINQLRNRLMADQLATPDAFAGIVTRSRSMRAVFQYTEVVSQSNQPILITGESGTGKELIARAIHRLSGCKGDLVPVNLAGLDDTMFSDTLFGHKRGAFTGADSIRDGLILKASGGVLFLDEIGDLPESSQIKLLRLIQEREFYPVGSDTPRVCNARIVCASNRNLEEQIKQGRFRNDLFYRLCVHRIDLPPLRERKDDLPLLLDHMIRLASQELGITPPAYPKELPALLATYHFPGNVRELQAMVHDAVARQQSKMLSLEPFRHVIMREQHAGLPQAPLDDTARLRMLETVWGHFPTLHEAETFLIEAALKQADGNQGVAATMLGLKRQTLNMRLKSRKKPA